MMGLRSVAAGLAAGALLVAGFTVTSPANANGYQPLTLTNVRVGANPITAGSDETTEFKVTVTNPNGYALQSDIYGEAAPGMTLVSVSGAGLNCQVNGQTFNCPSPAPGGPNIADNSTDEVTVTAKAEAWVTWPSLDLCAGVTWGLPNGPNGPAGELSKAGCGVPVAPGSGPAGETNSPSGNLEAVASVDVKQVADLELTVTQPGQTDPGAPATMTFTVKNNGPSYASPVTLRATLPAGLTFVSATPPWQCTASGQDVECTLAQDLATPSKAGMSGAVTETFPDLTWTVNTARPGTVSSYKVNAQVTSNATDPNPDNAKATSTVPVTPVVYELTKTAGGPYKIGDRVDWTLSVTNKGTFDDAGEITVTDKLPSALQFVSATGDGWTCSASGQTVTCKRAGLAKGQTSQAIITTKVVSAGSLKNQASLGTESYDSSSSVTSASDVVRARRLPQSTAPLPKQPFRIKSPKTTDQGQPLRTRVGCHPLPASVSGEVGYCKVTGKNGIIRVRVMGNQKMVVRVVQSAPGNKRYRPYLSAHRYIVKP